MTRDELVRLLLRLAIAFVGLQIVGVVLGLALFAYLWFGGEPPVLGHRFPDLELSR